VIASIIVESLLLLAVSLHRLPAGDLPVTDRMDTLSVQAARLQLFVSQSVLEDTKPESVRVVLPPDDRPLTIDEASQVLARLAKPAICSAYAAGHDVIVVACKQVESASEVTIYNADLSSNNRLLEAVLERAPMDSGGPIIFVERSNISMRVSSSVLERWFTDYCSRDNLAIAHGLSSEATGQSRYVLRIHNVLTVDPADLPPEMIQLIPPWLRPSRSENE